MENISSIAKNFVSENWKQNWNIRNCEQPAKPELHIPQTNSVWASKIYFKQTPQ